MVLAVTKEDLELSGRQQKSETVDPFVAIPVPTPKNAVENDREGVSHKSSKAIAWGATIATLMSTTAIGIAEMTGMGFGQQLAAAGSAITSMINSGGVSASTAVMIGIAGFVAGAMRNIDLNLKGRFDSMKNTFSQGMDDWKAKRDAEKKARMEAEVERAAREGSRLAQAGLRMKQIKEMSQAMPDSQFAQELIAQKSLLRTVGVATDGKNTVLRGNAGVINTICEGFKSFFSRKKGNAVVMEELARVQSLMYDKEKNVYFAKLEDSPIVKEISEGRAKVFIDEMKRGKDFAFLNEKTVGGYSLGGDWGMQASWEVGVEEGRMQVWARSSMKKPGEAEPVVTEQKFEGPNLREQLDAARIQVFGLPKPEFAQDNSKLFGVK